MQSCTTRQEQKDRERLEDNDRNESPVQNPGSETNTWENDKKSVEELDAHKQTLSKQVR